MLQIFIDLWGTILILWKCILSITLQLIRRKSFSLDKENGKRSNVYRFLQLDGRKFILTNGAIATDHSGMLV